ncbi:hypothetical protein [Streptomyces sp. NPDC051183]|uniref:hypothetical protein n=1 Tax=Streptomyces sp. NPDC051183 TaxID=3155165 RepID=UPI00343970F3
MSAVWVKGTTLHEDHFGQLVRADLIGHLLGSTEEVAAAQIGSETTVMLAHKASIGLGATPPDLPENFHLALLAKIAEARKEALESPEDLIILADLDDNNEWDWSIFPTSAILIP